MKQIIILCLALILLNACGSPESKKQEKSQNHPLVDSTQAKLEKLYQQGNLVGFSVVLVNDSAVLYQGSFGLANKPNHIPYLETTLQNIASVSKTFIGISLLKAQELDLLKLDDPINEYLPFEVKNPNFPEAPITIRHLATHTSGIIDTDAYQNSYIQLDSTIQDSLLNFNQIDQQIPMEAFLKKILHKSGEWYDPGGFLEAKPGSKYEYSNLGATLAALVLEKAAKETFTDFTQKHILDPLGMKASGWNPESVDMTYHSQLYPNLDDAAPMYTLITYPDGGMRTSTSDMAKYLMELVKGKMGKGTLLKPESYTEYFKAQLDDSHFEERDAEFPFNDEYNSGIFMGMSGTGLMVHTGSDPGTTTVLSINPANNIGRFFMANTDINGEAALNQLLWTMEALDEFEVAYLNQDSD